MSARVMGLRLRAVMARGAGLLCLLAIPGTSLAASDPGLPGPYAAGMETHQVPATAGATLTTDVHFPGSPGTLDAAASPCPVVVFGHGFTRGRARYANLAAHLASRGYLVLVPDFAGGSDHGRNADDLGALVDWILVRDGDSGSTFFGHVDGSAIASSGHSAGGLSALLAADRDPRIRVSAPLDPVDNGGLGAEALARLSIPLGLTWSEPGPCNANGSAEDLYTAAGATKRGVKVVDATHCDPEDPSDLLCTITCGSTDSGRQQLYRRHLTGWLEYHLRCRQDYEPWVYGAEVEAELAAGLITYAAEPDGTPACASPPPEVSRLLAVRSGDDVVLSWQPVAASPEVEAYRVYRSPDLELQAPLLVASPSGTSWTDGGAAASPSAHSWQVRAVSAAGEGP